MVPAFYYLASKKPMSVSKDALWKAIMEDLAEDLIRFFFPELAEHIDWEREILSLDIEARELGPESSSGN
jgi:hypothetical protein